ncbi:tryptophan synthase subunit alpha [Desulfotignum phosphitoxidans]|jgi:tryptophan synthase alpha chain|uniref:Tryptophan synthase alpha chain n=1 Tax=Desulfotignum phosphitoxidans DSM 13687 TaxID=1286635 RepID=S0FUX8_9BACT|nr:tryptophan synthase subunit alpha [Desulfotignum phosphitoxidans]EMS78898.1 tryptophan synthase alpha chain [Desulfotignum phosphitoxidans DSM 13687]
MLESYIRDKQKQKDLLLMTHIVMGYPSFDDSHAMVKHMVAAGVDLMELQIPFSEPMADGPVILKANQKALEQGATVAKCLAFAKDMAARYPIPFLFMTYANIPYRFGMAAFAKTTANIGLTGAIVPDLPMEEGAEYLQAMKKNQLSPIQMFSPGTSDARMAQIASIASGFIYCLARKGVTGAQTDLSDDLAQYLARCRKAASVPLAVGFGIKDRADMDFLAGRADIAVIGSETIRVMEKGGVAAVRDFIQGLSRSA